MIVACGTAEILLSPFGVIPRSLHSCGPEAGMPVMEGKCVLFKTFGDVDALDRISGRSILQLVEIHII